MKNKLPPHWGKHLVLIIFLFTFAAVSVFTLLPVMSYSSCENIGYQGSLSVELDQHTPIFNISMELWIDRIVIRDTRRSSVFPHLRSPPVVTRILNGTSVVASTILGTNQTNPTITVEWGFARSFNPFTIQFERTTEDTLFSCEITLIDTGCADAFGGGLYLMIFAIVVSIAIWLSFNLRRRTEEWYS